MFITDIIPVNKSKFKIITDDEIAFVLYKGDLSRYRLNIGSEIQEDLWNTLCKEVLPSRCYNRALGIFKTKDYTEYELRSKLYREGYLECIVDIIVERLIRERFIDDYRYACGYIRDKSKKKSHMIIVRELAQKGVSKNICEKAYDDVKEEGNLSDEEDCIKKLIVKRKYDENNATFEETQKLIRYLLSKGFSYDSINKVVKKSQIGYND